MPISIIPDPLPEGAPAQAACESGEMLALLARRRSTKIVHLTSPGPSGPEIDSLLQLAARVPDHGKLGPWRFVIMEGDGRARAGAALAQVLEAEGGDAASTEIARQTFMRAPVCVMVVSAAAAHAKIPEWEQQLSAGAVCFSLMLAAHARAYGGCWLTGWPCYSAPARKALGLSEDERIAGFIHLGTATETPTERARPDIAARISRI